jgi:hypothetical protein
VLDGAASLSLITTTEHQILRDIALSSIPSDAVSLDSLKPILSFSPRPSPSHHHTEPEFFKGDQNAGAVKAPVPGPDQSTSNDDEFGDFNNSSKVDPPPQSNHGTLSIKLKALSYAAESFVIFVDPVSTAALGLDLDFLASVKTSQGNKVSSNQELHHEYDDFFGAATASQTLPSHEATSSLHSMHHDSGVAMVFDDTGRNRMVSMPAAKANIPVVEPALPSKSGKVEVFLGNLPDLSFMYR